MEERKSRLATTVETLARLVSGRLIGDGDVAIDSARPVNEAGPRDITFVEDERYLKQLRTSPAAAAIVGPHFKLPQSESKLAVIEVENPRSAFVTIRSHLQGGETERWVGVHAMAAIDPTAKIGRNVAIHAFVAIGANVEIGDDCTLLPGSVVGNRCKMGAGCTLHPNVVLYEDVILGDRVEIHSGTIVGGDGFGYERVDGKHVKIPQTGGVEIGDDVEIGSNCAIDRGTFGATRIGSGTKIDNLVMIGHNNQIGEHNILCGQVGMAGSCKTGDHVVLAGQVGIKDHVDVGDRVIVGAQAGVHKNIPADQHVLGSPAIPIRQQRHIFAMIARLPEMHRQMRELEAQVALLTAALQAEHSAGETAADPALETVDDLR